MKARATKRQRPPLKRRKSNTENTLALCGYWSSPVQKVARKWIPKIGEHFCQHYLLDCFFSVRTGTREISVPLATPGHKRYVLEVMLAIDRVLNDRQKPDAWLLERFNSGRYEGGKPCLPTYEQLSKTIKPYCGITFSPVALAQCAHRLHLTDRKAP